MSCSAETGFEGAEKCIVMPMQGLAMQFVVISMVDKSIVRIIVRRCFVWHMGAKLAGDRWRFSHARGTARAIGLLGRLVIFLALF